jgi:DNA-binding NarL/FixJ family response regulator
MMSLKEFHTRVDAVAQSEQEGFDRFMRAVDRSPLARAGGSVIVYIEDDPDHVSFFKTIVAKYTTLTVVPALTTADGKRLIERKNGRTKCVVLDIGFERGSDEGLEMLAWLKVHYPGTPIIVLTSQTHIVPVIKEKYPDVEVHIKAGEDVETLVKSIEAAVALGV